MDVPEFVVWSLARRLVSEYGPRASYEAGLRISAAKSLGNYPHEVFWSAVSDATQKLFMRSIASEAPQVAAERMAEAD